ncbi:hypothetical protein TRAPUB_11740 [Trametes pubescens]|uniref:Uncharacterized protein n=1 Tax=Trametes pubescens TaxID=154538 RepID=A0A1M2VW40_TRAPU|nr:hypothetical protein TRAPUB_11740 [Trametes pubescens]
MVKTLAAFAHAHPHLSRLAVPSLDLDALPCRRAAPRAPPSAHRHRTLDAGKLLADLDLVNVVPQMRGGCGAARGV